MVKKKRWTDGKVKIWRDGAPYYVAPWVRDLTKLSRDSLFRGSYYEDGMSEPERKKLCEARHPQTTYIADQRAN